VTTCSVHVRDTAQDQPAAGVEVVLTDSAGGTHPACSDGSGRIGFADVELAAGRHEIRFLTGPWFVAQDRECFHPEVVVTFTAQPGEEHLHLGLHLDTGSYTTFRGETPTRSDA